jgi:hypothetical protein
MRIGSLFCILSVVIQSILAENTQQSRRTSSNAPSEFTVIFVSDVEAMYRGNRVDWCRNMVNYIKNLGREDSYFDDEFASVKIDPKLVVHGGDISDFTYGVWSWHKYGKRATKFLMDRIWGQLYDAGIPMISALGNHDYDEKREKIRVNDEANEFVLQSYEKSKALMGNDLSYVEYRKEGLPSQFVSDLWGFQFVNFNLKARFQQDGLKEGIDPNKKTMFFSHYPLMQYDFEDEDPTSDWLEAGWKDNTFDDVVSTMRRFTTSRDPRAHHFSGHLHGRIDNINIEGVTDHVAAYPHPWLIKDDNCPTDRLDSGFYAILVSPTEGVLQVKPIEFSYDKYQRITKCKKDGERCSAIRRTCKLCCAHVGSRWKDRKQRCGLQKCYKK